MLKRIYESIKFTEDDCTPGWCDNGRAEAISTLDAEIEALTPIVENLTTLNTDLTDYSTNLESLIGDYGTTMDSINDVGFFNGGSADSLGLFEGSKECLEGIKGAVDNMQKQIESDLESNKQALDDAVAERAKYEQDEHLGEVECCV